MLDPEDYVESCCSPGGRCACGAPGHRHVHAGEERPRIPLKEVIAECDRLGITMVMNGVRLFHH